VTISNYSISILIHFLKVKKLQNIMNILNNNIEFKKVSSSKIAKTDNMVLTHLMDAGFGRFLS